MIAHGERLFSANWTVQEGDGRPLSKGTGAHLLDPSTPLIFPRNFNRVSGPDANSCSGCHNAPYRIAGGGDITANVFVLGQGTTRLIVDENGAPKMWPPNRLTSIAPAGPNRMTVSWQGGTGLGTSPRIYQLQHCTDLSTGVWDDVGGPTLNTSATNATSPR